MALAKTLECRYDKIARSAPSRWRGMPSSSRNVGFRDSVLPENPQSLPPYQRQFWGKMRLRVSVLRLRACT